MLLPEGSWAWLLFDFGWLVWRLARLNLNAYEVGLIVGGGAASANPRGFLA